jgi:type II secretory pathway component PulM
MNPTIQATNAVLSTEWAAVLSFGPVGFGVVLLLVVWRFIVAPEMERSRKQSETTLPILLAISESARACTENARLAADSAKAASEHVRDVMREALR